MTREQIEKAAKIYIDEFLPDHIDYANINNEEDNYESGRNNALCEFGEEIFKAGSRWRINSVWHDTREIPKEGEHIVIATASGNFSSWYVTLDIMQVFDEFNVKLWARSSDLLPEGKEETE